MIFSSKVDFSEANYSPIPLLLMEEGSPKIHLADVPILCNAAKIHRLRPSKETNGIGYITGKNIRVGIFDDGFFLAHPYFQMSGYNVNSDVDTQEDQEHGTMTGASFLSIAPDAILNEYEVSGNLGIYKWEPTQNEIEKKAEALADLLDNAIERGLRVISISLGWIKYGNQFGSDLRGSYQEYEAEKLQQRIKKLTDAGIIVCVAAGNDQDKDLFPAILNDVISVGGVSIGDLNNYDYNSVNRFDKEISQSLFDLEISDSSASYPVAKTTYIEEHHVPDICGIFGDLILPTKITEENPSGWSMGKGMGEGTSFATPQVAGVCALLKEVEDHFYPLKLSTGAIKRILQKTAIPIKKGVSGTKEPANIAGGAGLINACKAVRVAISGLKELKEKEAE